MISGYTKKLTPHILRHTYCTTLRNNGADISYIKELAGHSDIQITARYYLGRDTQQLRNVVRKYVRYDATAAVDTESDPTHTANT
jgi:site-specific recombinase XerD